MTLETSQTDELTVSRAGGIREEALTALGKDETVGLISGRPLEYDNTDRKMMIRDKQDKGLMFLAEILPDGHLHFDVITKGFGGDEDARHPDLFATKLMAKALDIFRQRGIQIKGVVADWFFVSHYAGDYSREYRNNLKAGMTPEEAAKNTRFGQLVTSWGFPYIESMTEEKGPDGFVFAVKFIFVPEPSTPTQW